MGISTGNGIGIGMGKGKGMGPQGAERAEEAQANLQSWFENRAQQVNRMKKSSQEEKDIEGCVGRSAVLVIYDTDGTFRFAGYVDGDGKIKMTDPDRIQPNITCEMLGSTFMKLVDGEWDPEFAARAGFLKFRGDRWLADFRIIWRNMLTRHPTLISRRKR